MVEDAGRGWRRVVPSPRPVKIIEIEIIKDLLSLGLIVITVGGGGIPVIEEADGTLSGVAAVIDKDLAAEELAQQIGAGILLMAQCLQQRAVCSDRAVFAQNVVNRRTSGHAREPPVALSAHGRGRIR